MKKTFGIFAHVDAGKTSLSEQILFLSGAKRSVGRVDDKNTSLDFEQIEKERGITVYSSVARFPIDDDEYFLIDTPGHTDFSAEAENALNVPDFAVLVVSGTEGVQAHTKTLWELLKVPVFIFVSKTDRPEFDKNRIIKNLQTELSGRIVDYANSENVAEADEKLLDCFLSGTSPISRLCELVSSRKIFPCFFGSSLTGNGIKELMDAFSLIKTDYSSDGKPKIKIFKIRHDTKGKRICFIKVLSGTLFVKDEIEGEKVDEIRLYDGDKFTAVQKAEAGTVCAVCGLSSPLKTSHSLLPTLRTAVSCGLPSPVTYEKLKLFEDENPLLNISSSLEISVSGQIQLEALAEEFFRRYAEKITFSEPRVLYKETVTEPILGLGHYEPLRHYADVILKIEPSVRDSGISFESIVSTDELDKNFQNLIRTHVFEKEHIGILTGSPLTDVKITLMAAKTHLKHTEGGDLRQATYRAIRQALMSNPQKCILLEPFYSFSVTLPCECCGKLLADLQRMNAVFSPPATKGNSTTVEGKAAVSKIMNYAVELSSYSHGTGVISMHFDGYSKCDDEKAVIEAIAYNAGADGENPCGSIFCAKGAGFYVPYNEVSAHINSEIPKI